MAIDKRVCINGIILLLLLAVLPAHAILQRWAVLGSVTGEEAALCDLVSAELSGITGLVQVDREALKSLTDEQLLSDTLSAEGTGSRLRLGRMLDADALLVIRLVKQEDRRILMVIVIDCPTGTRLRIEQFPWQQDQLPALAGHLRDLVVAVRQQYANGITKIVGVPNFLSRSFSRQYDPLQEAYSLLLQQVLMLEPGIAVIDTSEAQAIGRELAIGGQPALERMLPMLIQGEFRVETPPGAAPSIDLKVTLNDKSGVIGTADSGLLALDKAPEWITTTLPAKVLAGQANAKPLSPIEQARLLANQAEAFAKLGSYDQSIQLRESVLLLNPELSQERLALIDEYLRRSSGSAGDKDPASIVASYIRSLEHAEAVIRQEQVSSWAISSMLERLSKFSGRMLNEYAKLPKSEEPFGKLKLDEANAARQSFLLATLPALYSNLAKTKDKDPFIGALGMAHINTSYLITGSCTHFGITREDFAFIRRAAEVIPAETLPPNTMHLLLPDYYEGHTYYKSEADYLDLLRCLAASDNPRVKALARYHLLLAKFEKVQGNKEGLLALQAELDQFWADQFPNAKEKPRISCKLGGKIASALNRIETAKPAQPLQVISAVDFQKIAFTGAPNIHMSGISILACTGFDVIWWKYAGYICLHRQAGVLTSIPFPAGGKPGILMDVAWDERRIWVATQFAGLWIYDAEGRYLGAVASADGLPAYDAELRLYPVAPGRVLAVGVSDTEKHAWCAMLSWDDDTRKANVNVFHEATESPAGNTNPDRYAHNALSTFSQCSFFRLDGIVPGDGSVLGIVRWLNMPGTTWYLDPLTIDLTSLQVGVWTFVTGMQPLTKFEPKLLTAAGGVLGLDNDYRPYLRVTVAVPGKNPAYYPVPISNPGDGSQQHNFFEQRFPDRITLDDPIPASLSPAPDGWIYLASSKWWRIDPKTLTAQRLTTQQLPANYRGMTIGVSSLLGLVAWNDAGCYRVVIDETKIPKTGD